MDRTEIADSKMQMKPWSMLVGLTLPMLWRGKDYSGTIVCTGDFTRSIVFWLTWCEVQDNPLKRVGTSEEMEARLEYEDAVLKKRERAANSSDYGSGSSPSSKSNAGNSERKLHFLSV